MKKKIVLIRLDKIGDLICTLPVDQMIDPNEFEVTWIVQQGLGAIVDLGAKQRSYFEIDKKNPKESSTRLAEILKKLKPDVAISFQAPWWVNVQLFKAGIPVRSGVKSQWHSFLFLNRALRQKRSQALKHELDYNLDLVRHTLHLKQTRQLFYFDIQPPTQDLTLQKYKLNPKKYGVVHPGMMGSALNWKPANYIHFIQGQIANQKQIVITGTDSDEPYLVEIKKQFEDNPFVLILQSQLNFQQLVEILFHAEFVLAPSTGVLHLAASVGAKTIGLYSPIRVHHPRRWAARGRDVQILVPAVDCPATHQCLKEKCSYYDCMDQIKVNV